jgi:hypothetical protein
MCVVQGGDGLTLVCFSTGLNSCSSSSPQVRAVGSGIPGHEIAAATSRIFADAVRLRLSVSAPKSRRSCSTHNQCSHRKSLRK